MNRNISRLGPLALQPPPAAGQAAISAYLIVFGVSESIKPTQGRRYFSGLFVKEQTKASLLETICISWLAEELNAQHSTSHLNRPLWRQLDFHSQFSITNPSVLAFPCGEPFEMDLSFMRKQSGAATY